MMMARSCAVALCISGFFAALASSAKAGPGNQPSQPWMRSFRLDVKELATEGENPYFILNPGYQLTLEGKEAGAPVQLIVTVLRETITIGGVETRVVEERETSRGLIAEVSRNFFAIHPRTKDVYYFGEDVDIYKNGKVDRHEGAWRHGTGNAHFGLMMPGMPDRRPAPLPGARAKGCDGSRGGGQRQREIDDAGRDVRGVPQGERDDAA